MKNLIISLIGGVIFMALIPGTIILREKSYKVTCRIKVGTCTTTKEIIVQALSSSQAERFAAEEAQQSTQVSTSNVREIR